MIHFYKTLIAIIGLVLVGCSSGQTATSVSLPLSTSQPTLIFFYTDN